MNVPHLSVVATSRNDNHGGSLTYRMQHFIDGFIKQCGRHSLKAELILVEWNPPDDTPPLQEALRFPVESGPCTVRIIRVPKQVHISLKNSEHLPLFQMIGKNVGIKRALGKFVLATNIDILFSDAVICWMRDQLEAGKLYRVDRLDVPSQLPSTDSIQEILAFCNDQYFRINGKWGTLSRSFGLDNLRKLKRILKNKMGIDKTVQLHNNACGDFTLLSYADWERLRGYPEWEIFSWHIDSIFLHQAYYHGIIEVDLPTSIPIYHIEHSPGSGYSPEGQELLFHRLEQKGITYLKNHEFFDRVRQMKDQIGPVIYNQSDWGLSSLSLDEVVIGAS